MIKLDHIAGLIAVAAIVALSLWPLKSHGGDEQEHGDDSAASGHAVHWSYAGAEGPEHWGDLSPAFAACKSGRMQSPSILLMTPPGLLSMHQTMTMRIKRRRSVSSITAIPFS